MIKTIAENYNILEITTRILVAYFMGIFIGMERAHHKKPIGSRTTSIVCMGAALLSCYEEVFAKSIILQNFNLVNLKSELLYRIPDYNRITAQIVSGIGFLGAGMIIQNRGKLYGITTAAIVWTTACLGIVIGSGQWVLSAIGGICIFCSTYIYKLPYIITNKKNSMYYIIEVPVKIDLEAELEKFAIRILHLKIIGWKSNTDDTAPNIVKKIHIYVPEIDYQNVEKIFKSINVNIIKVLNNMKED